MTWENAKMLFWKKAEYKISMPCSFDLTVGSQFFFPIIFWSIPTPTTQLHDNKLQIFLIILLSFHSS
jgi:hypothetical protein